MGPGTHIISNINKGVQPTTYTDAIALTHDINYLIATANPKQLALADDLAISKAKYNASGILMKVGLTLRKWTGIKDNEGRQQATELSHIGKSLKDVVLNDPKFERAREQYGIDTSFFL